MALKKISPISIHNWVYIFPSCFFGTYSDVLCSEECQTKKLLYVVKCLLFSKPFSNSVPQKNCS